MKNASTEGTTNNNGILAASRIADRTTMRNNSKAYGVCVFENAEKLQSYIDVNGIKSKNFQKAFSCDVWFYPTQNSYTLLSQSDGFSLNVRNNKFNFTFANGQSVDAINTESEDPLPEITMRGWNSIFVTYDGETISFYLQGCPIYSKRVGSHRVVSKDDAAYKIGGDFTGQMRSVRIYNKALPNTEEDYGINRYICKYDYDKSSMKELIAWIDFEQSEIKSVTGLSLQFHMHNVCYLDNAIQAISVTEHDYAYTIDTKLNPIATRGHQHAIFIKFFTSQSNAEKQVLFSNGDFYDNDAMIIYLSNIIDQESNATRVRMKIGQQDIEVPSEIGYIPNYTWNDLLVTFLESNNQITAYFYINGDLYGSASLAAPYNGKKGNGAVKLGNAFEMHDDGNKSTSNPFNGYITTVAIFDQTLIDSNNHSFVGTCKPSGFHNNEPFVYEPGLVALYSMEGSTPMDLISGKTIIMHNNVQSAGEIEQNINTVCISVTGTNNPNLETEVYKPSLPDYKKVAEKNSLSKRNQKNLDKLGKILSVYFSSVCGILLSEDNMKLFLYSSGKEFLATELMSNISAGQKITGGMTEEFIGGMTPNASGVFVGLAAVGTIAAGASIGSVVACSTGCVATCIAGILFIVNLIIILDKIDPEKPEPDPEVPEEITLTYQSFKIGAKSLEGFNAAPTVSYARNEVIRNSIEEPTWQPSCGIDGNPSVFIIDKLIDGTIELKFFLRSVGEKAPKKARVTIEMIATSNGNLFNKFTGTAEDCVVDSANTITLKSEKYNPPSEDNIYKYTTAYTITCTVNETPDSTLFVNLPMYSIPKRPRKPIGHGKRNAIIVEFLDMLSTSATSVLAAYQDVQKTKLTTCKVSVSYVDIMNNVFWNQNIQYSGLAEYADKIIINNESQIVYLAVDKIQIGYNYYIQYNQPYVMGCQTFSAITAYLFKLINLDVSLYFIRDHAKILITNYLLVAGRYHGEINVHKICDYTSSSGVVIPIYEVQSISEFKAVVFSFNYHVIVGDNSLLVIDTLVIDPCARLSFLKPTAVTMPYYLSVTFPENQCSFLKYGINGSNYIFFLPMLQKI